MSTHPRIAVVGIACRYPDATSPSELWQNVLGQRRAFRRLPEERLSAAYFGEPDAPDLTYVRRAALLSDWEFDRARFGIPSALHRAADHTHWLALETAAAALADAGQHDGEGLDRDTTGVVLGNSLTGEFSRAGALRTRWPYVRDAAVTALRNSGAPSDLTTDVIARMEELVKAPFPVPGDESLAGSLANTIAGRICNQFDFHGTGYTVDGACSSSLLAIMSACRALASGELDFALAGGVDLSLDPFELVGFARVGALATDRMRVYDGAPTGFLPGEGCGVLALARAADADRLGMRSYAHIVGWGSSSDGSGGLTRPERRGQALALRRAGQMADFSPESIGLIEGHGTGTAVGDATELAALTEVRGAGSRKAALGSIKANIGHTKAAAGVAGLIKAVYAVHHGVLPPTTGCDEPHELLTRTTTPLRIVRTAEPWREEIRRAGVSAMGFGGINAHLVLEYRSEPAAVVPPRMRRWTAEAPEHDIFFVEADDASALSERLDAIATSAGHRSDAELHDLAVTLWYERRGKPLRAALVADCPERLAEVAGSARDCSARADRLVLNPRAGYAIGNGDSAMVGLLFPGQAAPVRTALPAWAEHYPQVPEVPGIAADDPTDTAVAQPAIVRQSLAGSTWLQRLGCHPVAAAGHSLGEISALAWAGAFTPEQALRLAAARGRIMSEYADADSSMVSLATGVEGARRLIANTGVVIAAYNGPEQLVVAGSTGELNALIRRASDAGVAATKLAVSHGFHSPAMRSAVEPFRQHLRALDAGALRGTVLSTITGAKIADVDDVGALLARQFTEPVRFIEALDALGRRCDLLVETGPGTILSELARNAGYTPAISLDCGGPPARRVFATAALAAARSADLDAWFADRAFRRVLPEIVPRLLANPCEVTADRERSGMQPPARPEPQPEPPRAPYSAEPLAALVEHLSTVLDLPAESIKPSSSLLSDLHLNSLQAAQLAAKVATSLGKRLPGSPLSLADATVAEAAAMLDQLDSGTTSSITAPAIPPGVRGWVRAFSAHRIPDTPAAEQNGLSWAVQAPRDHWLQQYAADGADGMAVVLEEGTTRTEVAEILREIGDAEPERLLIVHSGHPAAAAIGRSAVVEQDPRWVRVVELDDPNTRFDPGLIADAVSEPYAELRIDRDGPVERTVLRNEDLSGDAAMPLETGDVCLVTGGVRGITAFAAAALSEATGCTLVILGRTAADDPAVSAALGELRSRVDAHYLSCDVTDASAVRTAAERARSFGLLRGVIHGAGNNEPRRLAEVTAHSAHRAIAPKVDGLASVLAATETDELRLVLAFGSIIGRAALPGQAEYCLANDAMRQQAEAWAVQHPACRAHVLEWSVWAGIGMGVDLGVLDSLSAAGVVPMGAEQATNAMLELLRTAGLPVTLLITSRVPAMPTLVFEETAAPLLRFDEERRARTPGVEIISEAALNTTADPYLEDHRIGGLPVLPAVFGLEAIMQVAAVGSTGSGSSFEDVRFRRPIALNAGRVTIRTAVLSDGTGADAVIRDDQDDFAADSITARIVPMLPAPATRAPRVPPDPETRPHPFYDGLLFHRRRFQRLLSYEVLSAFDVRAWIRADPDAEWFSAYHSPELLLGDPGAHDAALHALLACVPHRLALPEGADRVTMWRRPAGILRMLATEVEHTPDTYRFDIDVLQPDGAAVARWEGLRLRAVSPRPWPDGVPVSLVGPWLSRRLLEAGLDDHIELISTAGSRTSDSAREIAAQVCGCPVGHDARGALRVHGRRRGSPVHAGASYTGGALLLGLSPAPLGLDWQHGDPLAPVEPAHLVPADQKWADEVCDKTGEAVHNAALRAWSVREALIKLGHEQQPILPIDHVAADGLVVAESGPIRVVSATVAVEGLGDTAIALAQRMR